MFNFDLDVTTARPARPFPAKGAKPVRKYEFDLESMKVGDSRQPPYDGSRKQYWAFSQVLQEYRRRNEGVRFKVRASRAGVVPPTFTFWRVA